MPCMCGDTECPSCGTAQGTRSITGPMGLDEVKQEALDRGYTHVHTAYGLLWIAQFHPYGVATWRGRWVSEDTVEDYLTPRSPNWPEVLGQWRFEEVLDPDDD